MARRQLFWTVVIPLLQSHEPDSLLLPDGVLLQCMQPGGEDGHRLPSYFGLYLL